jgi:hypothetical protein
VNSDNKFNAIIKVEKENVKIEGDFQKAKMKIRIKSRSNENKIH